MGASVRAPDAPNADFLIQGPAEHGVAGLVNLYGIESPGLTASLALAEHVVSHMTDPTRVPVAAAARAG